MNNFNRISDTDIKIISLLYLVIGILLFSFSEDIIMLGCRIMGIVLILVGVYFLYCFFIKRTSPNPSPFFIGLPTIIIGIYMAIAPQGFVAITPMLVGALFIVTSIITTQKSLMMKDLGVSFWKVSLLENAILLIVGIVLFLKPIQSLSFIMQIVGLSLIVEAIFLYWNHHVVKKYNEQ